MSSRKYTFEHDGILDPRPTTLDDNDFVSLSASDLDEVSTPEELEENQCYLTYAPEEGPFNYWGFEGHSEDSRTFIDMPLWTEPEEIPKLAAHDSIEEEIYVWTVWDEEGQLNTNQEDNIRDVFWNEYQTSYSEEAVLE